MEEKTGQERDVGYLLGAFEGFDKRFNQFTHEIRNEVADLKSNLRNFINTYVNKTEFNQVVNDLNSMKLTQVEFDKRQEKIDRKLFKWGLIISGVQLAISIFVVPIALFVTTKILGNWIDSLFK